MTCNVNQRFILGRHPSYGYGVYDKEERRFADWGDSTYELPYVREALRNLRGNRTPVEYYSWMTDIRDGDVEVI